MERGARKEKCGVYGEESANRLVVLGLRVSIV